MSRWIRVIFVLAAALLLLPSSSQSEETPDRPRIGLCLAGGGARGGAHIGVLRVLEELRIPVDCIAGTSIGAIIGGLYASGMSPADMDSTLLSLDWGVLLSDQSPHKLISIRRKEEDLYPYFPFEIGFGTDGVRLPAGLIAGQRLNFLLRALTIHATGIEDFDDLPIPFRAVAASLNDGSIVVLDHGTLADAMRASMAIPGAFTPHNIDGQNLMDGGIVRNVPYDVVRSMDADIVIVVDVGKPLSELDADPSVLGVLSQTVEVAITSNAQQSLAQVTDTDFVLVPELEGIGVESFDRMAEASAGGEKVARQHADQLSRLSLSEVEYEEWREGQRVGYSQLEIPIRAVRIDSPGRIDPRRVRRRVQSPPETPLDLDLLAEDLSRVHRLGEFELVDFSLEATEDPDARDLVIHTRDKRWGPNYLRFGMSLEDHFQGQTRFLFLLYHRWSEVNRLGGEWRNQASFGDRIALDTEFYQPLLRSGGVFVAPRLLGSIDERQRWLSSDISGLIESKQYEARFDVGASVSHWGELRVGLYRGEYKGRLKNFSSERDLDEALGGWRARFFADQLDSWNFPRRGWAMQGSGRISRTDLGASTEYDKLGVTMVGAATKGRATVFGRVEGGTSFQSKLPFHDRFELGGLWRLSGLEYGRVFGDDMALMTTGVFARIGQLGQTLGRSIYVGLSGEAGQAWGHAEKPALSDLIFGGTVFLGVEALLGPIYLGYGVAEAGNRTFYLILGRTNWTD